MSKEVIKYKWFQQSMSDHFEVIDCPKYDAIKDFQRDPTGCYVLIRLDIKQSLIEVAICDKRHVVLKAFRGPKAQDLYHTIFVYEKKHKLEWFKNKDHMAYLGKELKKAEFAMFAQENYVQE